MTEHEQQQLLQRAKHACAAMTTFLLEENDALRARRIEDVDAGLKNKVRLAREMERELTAVKDAKPHLDENIRLATEMKVLQSALDDYKSHARQNMTMLQAAHQTTANFMRMVKEMVEERLPKSGAYNNKGQAGGATISNRAFVNKAV